jgi:betaine reductase
MDLGNQARIKELADKYNKSDIVVVLGGAEAEASGLAAETVSNGDPAYAGPLAGVQLGLKAYHVVEPIIKDEVDASVYDEQVSMMEMVLDVDAIVKEVSTIRQQFTGPN